MPNYIPIPTQKNISGIYEILCFANQKRYIGSAEDLRHRRNNHLAMLRNYKHHNIHLQRAWNKHGEAMFIFSVLEFCHVDDLLQREQFYLDTLHPEFNISLDAASPMKGRKHTDESRKAISKWSANFERTEKHRQNIANALKGKTRPENVRQKVSKSLIARADKLGRKPKKRYYIKKGLATDDRNGARLHPEKLARGEKHGFHFHPEKWMRGEKVNTAKLTSKDVIQIRELHKSGLSTYKLAEMFNVNPSAIQKVVNRINWKHIP